MSEPSRLLERIESGFRTGSRTGDAPPVAPLPVEVSPPAHEQEAPVKGKRHAVNQASLALLGLVASGLILVIGMSAGFYLFSAAIAAAGSVGVFLLVAALSGTILPPTGLLIAVLVCAALLVTALWRWFVRIHATMQIALRETLDEQPDP